MINKQFKQITHRQKSLNESLIKISSNLCHNYGFTITEIIIVVMIALIIFLAVQLIFSRGVKNTIKGQDDLETIRAGSQLFAEIRRDLLGCSGIQVVDNASFVLDIGETTIPAFPNNATQIAFSYRGATITYKLDTLPDGKKLVNRIEATDTSIKVREFGVPRMISFKAMEITKRQQIFDGGPFNEKQILIEIEIDSKDKRFPTRNLKLTSFFISSQLTSSNWNYFY